MLKRVLQICLGIVLVVELTGCVYYSSERRYHPYWYHPDAVVVHVHD
jgi:hypothetical protein